MFGLDSPMAKRVHSCEKFVRGKPIFFFTGEVMLKRRNLSMAAPLRAVVACIVLVGVTAFVTSKVVSDDKPGDKHGGQPEMDPAMAKMIEMGTPGPEHVLLEAMVGEWAAECTMEMEPGKPTTTKARSKNHWIMDKRFVQQDYAGDFMGMPFSGMSLIGYDKYQKKYVSTWIDSMSTMIYMSLGTYDAATKTFTFEGEGPDCMDPTGTKLSKMKNVVKVLSKDKHTFTMYQQMDGKMVQSMEITYTRK